MGRRRSTSHDRRGFSPPQAAGLLALAVRGVWLEPLPVLLDIFSQGDKYFAVDRACMLFCELSHLVDHFLR